MPTKNIVVIGGVAAGPKTACRLKRLLPDARVTVIDQDNLISYGGCGIPYYVSGDVSDEKELRNTSFHMTRDTSFFLNAKGVEVMTKTRALAIDRKAKSVRIRNLDTDREESLPYDKLVITTGSEPFVPPIPGAELDGVYTISDLHKAIDIKEQLAKGRVERAVVIGGGAIGIEMAEAFTDLWGVETSLIEFMPQLLPNILDKPFAAMLATHLREHGVNVYLNEAARTIEAGNDGRAGKVITANREIEANLVVMAVGVRPRTELAREAGLQVSKFGIVVNDRLQTSDPDIYAAGDCIETTHLVSGKKGLAPMGSLANREGRIVADNLAGMPSTFEGWIGSFMMKAFDICVGGTGLSYQAAKAEGFDADFVISAQSDRAHFFPEQSVIPLQMVFDRRNRRVLGVQGFGPMGDAVLARIDAAAGLIVKNGTIDDFSKLEMAYAPPFATALDALNATANIADNKAAGRLRTASIDDFMAWMDEQTGNPDWLVLDIRHPAETAAFTDKFGDRWLAIPYIEIRNRYREIPTDKIIIIVCDAGTRSYEVQGILDHHGWKSLVLGGGFNCIRRIGAAWWPS
ncbi:MAG: FAD-dependent oxidoreductase [Desulfurivibrionaceae bacterium]|nr:FAD-dependent oxidoreductase [Desulfurivibrionaceae bacterium]